MSALKPGIAALVLVAGLSTPARAQKSAPAVATGAYPARQVTDGVTAYYGMTPNFANYGLSGSYPSNGGYGYSAFGPGPQFGAHFAPSTTSNPPKSQARPGADTTKGSPKPTAKPLGQGSGPVQGVSRPRKGL